MKKTIKQKLIFDLDDTIVEFIDPWLEWIYNQNISEIRHKPAEVLHYSWMTEKYGDKVRDFFLEDPIKCYSKWVKPYPDAKEIFNICSEFFDVEIVTHSLKKETEIAKTNFVKEYISEQAKIRFFDSLHDKYLYTENSILIDDYPYHSIKHTSHNKMPSIIFDYNKRNGWSKPKNYMNMLIEENSKMNLLFYATDYKEVLEILEIFK